jgi:ribosomal protein S18 acetylase RimI-like enzyme
MPPVSAMPPTPVTPGELDDVVAFVAEQQAHADRRISYVGNEAAGIAAELGGLAPPWATTARVLRQGPGVAGIGGAVVVEWDEKLGRAWVVGPWVRGDGPGWAAAGEALVDAALAQVPAGITQYEMAGDVANTRLAALAAARGWAATEPNHILVADAAVVAAWAPGAPATLRPATPGDVAVIEPWHDAEFPDAYASADQLVEGEVDGSRVVLVAVQADGHGDARVVGYAAGQVHDDGEGFVDFVGVDPAARRGGVGRQLVEALTRRLLERSSAGRVCLTVQDHRAPARALYARLGFRPDGVLVAYRSWRR